MPCDGSAHPGGLTLTCATRDSTDSQDSLTLTCATRVTAVSQDGLTLMCATQDLQPPRRRPNTFVCYPRLAATQTEAQHFCVLPETWSTSMERTWYRGESVVQIEARLVTRNRGCRRAHMLWPSVVTATSQLSLGSETGGHAEMERVSCQFSWGSPPVQLSHL